MLHAVEDTVYNVLGHSECSTGSNRAMLPRDYPPYYDLLGGCIWYARHLS